MNILEIVKIGLLGAVAIICLIVGIVIIAAKLGLALIILLSIAVTCLIAYKIIDVLQGKGII